MSNKSQLLNEISENVKNEVIKEYQDNEHLYDEDDIHDIKNNQWLIRRVVVQKKENYNASVDFLKTYLQWRKQEEISQLKDTDFPKEFYKRADIFPYLSDKSGIKIVHMRVKLYRKIPELDLLFKRFVLHVFDKVDKETKGQVTVVFNCQGVNFSNVDMSLAWYLISLTRHTPKFVNNVLVYEMPFILNSIWRIIKPCLPEEYAKMINFVNKKSITDYIDTNNIPDFMGGHCKLDYRIVPEGCPNVEDILKDKDLNQSRIDKIKKIYQELIDQADKDQLKY